MSDRWRAAQLGALLAMVTWLGACHVGRATIASSGDYADYRRIRLAPTLAERLTAAWYYGRFRSDGQYVQRVRRYFDEAEPVFWAVKRQTEAGLEEYLAALPDGPHAEQALAELMRRRNDRRRAQAEQFDPARSRARFEAAAKRRREAAALALDWLRLLVAPSSWDRPLSQASGELLARYRLALPAPECEPRESEGGVVCMKLVERPFDVVVEGESVDREVEMWVTLTLNDRWRLERAWLQGPDLFVRHVEASRRRPVDATDEAVRRRANERFLRRAMVVLSEPSLDCQPVEAPAGLALRCGAVRVVLTPGEGGEDDSILLSRQAP